MWGFLGSRDVQGAGVLCRAQLLPSPFNLVYAEASGLCKLPFVKAWLQDYTADGFSTRLDLFHCKTRYLPYSTCGQGGYCQLLDQHWVFVGVLKLFGSTLSRFCSALLRKFLLLDHGHRRS